MPTLLLLEYTQIYDITHGTIQVTAARMANAICSPPLSRPVVTSIFDPLTSKLLCQFLLTITFYGFLFRVNGVHGTDKQTNGRGATRNAASYLGGLYNKTVHR